MFAQVSDLASGGQGGSNRPERASSQGFQELDGDIAAVDGRR